MALLESLYQSLLPWLPLLTISGLVMAIASAVALPWILIRLPEDYFVATQQHKPDRSPLGWLVWLLRNSLAIVLFIVGLRSEEHTSELQSRPHLVCRLLLEKKK